MAEFHVVRRRRKNCRKDKGEKSLIERITVIKNDLRLTKFYEKSVNTIRNCLHMKLDESEITENKDIQESSVLNGSTIAEKDRTSTKSADSQESTNKLENGVREIHIGKSDNGGVKENVEKETNLENSLDKTYAPEPDYIFEENGDVKETIQEVICYGLGNFSDSHIARYQLAFLLLTVEEMDIPVCKCHIFDPKFNNEEKLSLQKLGFNLIEENEVGKRRSNRKTVFYMPHCGKALYNNLLWANWGIGLKNVIIIGNSFSRMVDNTPMRILNKTAHYILKVQPYVTEAELPVTDKFEDVFNDTVIHTFNDLETKVQDEFWDDRLEPHYENEDPEIIFN